MQAIGKYRWVVVALLFFATTINYLDRQVIGLLKDSLSKEFNWSEKDYSNIVIAFTASYAVGLFFFGWIIDWIGTKSGYIVSIIIWSIAAMAHALAKSTFGFGVARTALGLGEAGNFPTAIKAVAEWFPKKERALATGIFNSGTNIAAVLGPPVVTWLLYSYGWKSTFIWTGIIGFIWLIFWFWLYEIPSKQKRLGKEEFDYIHSDDENAVEKVGWQKILGVKQTWAFVLGKFLTDPIWWFYLFWIPSYFNTTYSLDLKKSAVHVSTVYVVASLGSIFGGYLSGFFIRKGWAVYRARKVVMLCYAFCVVPIIFVRFTNDIWVAVALISLAAAAHQAWSANIFTTASDMFPKRAVSSVVGLGGMAGSFGGVVVPLFSGIILDHFKALGTLNTGYNIIFSICGCAYLLAWFIMHLLAPKMQRVEV
ncbi:MAG: MFS transporter [Bacteroidetes bacterium]|nr:MFS transporter [Bacteroidota bacterium]